MRALVIFIAAFLFDPAATLAAQEKLHFLQDLESFRANSRTVRTELENLRSSETFALSKKFFWMPDLSISTGKDSTSVNGQKTSNPNYLSANSSINLFRGGKDFYSLRSALTARDAQEIQVASEELRVELAGANAIFDFLFLRDSYQVQAELVKLKEDSLRIGRSRYAQGRIPLQEVTKMEVDLSQQRLHLHEVELQREANTLAYHTLFVNELRTNDWPFADDQRINFSSAQGSLDVKKSQLTSESLADAWKSAKISHWPSVDLSLSYRQYPLRTRENEQWIGSMSLTLPLWSRFETSASTADAYARYAAAENTAEITANETKLKEAYLRKKINLSQQNLQESRRNLEKSDRLYKDMLRSFQLGRLSTNDLFQEQDRRFQSLNSFYQSRLSFHQSLMEACVLWGTRVSSCIP